jgi:hypothetical protein
MRESMTYWQSPLATGWVELNKRKSNYVKTANEEFTPVLSKKR